MSDSEAEGGRATDLGASDVRSFLEHLRNRVLRVTTGMRAGHQRLELAIEAFWYAALEVAPAVGTVPWRTYAAADHPMRNLLGPIRLMLRSELINSGISTPDAVLDEALLRMLEVAEAEGRRNQPDSRQRDEYRRWLLGSLRAAGHPVSSSSMLHEAA